MRRSAFKGLVYYEKSSPEISNGDMPLFIFHHGAGQSGLVFDLVSEYVLKSISARIVMFDCRGHGASFTDDDSDLSLERLTADFVDIFNEVKMNSKQIFLIGHSLGGAVVVNGMSKGLGSIVKGVVVLDVVEGSALESLSKMNIILASRPRQFRSIQDAVDWAINTRQVRNRKSAESSLPHQLVQEGQVWKWRADLSQSSRFWQSWFIGLSEKFLSCKAAKLLVLAGTDRLDKPLTIAQMQGKFQMEILADSGHFIQEDEPEKLAEILVQFYRRNQPLDLTKIKKLP